MGRVRDMIVQDSRGRPLRLTVTSEVMGGSALKVCWRGERGGGEGGNVRGKRRRGRGRESLQEEGKREWEGRRRVGGREGGMEVGRENKREQKCGEERRVRKSCIRVSISFSSDIHIMCLLAR